MLFVYIVKISHLTKFKCGSFLLREEEERRRWLKKKKGKRRKNWPKEERHRTSLENRMIQDKKQLLGESHRYWWSSTLASRFRIKKSPSDQNLSYIMLKTRFPFVYPSTINTSHSYLF